jgi:hypothetical protein
MKSLASLFYGADRIERELKRTGVLVEPPIPLSDQEQAEHDRLIALVDAHATEHEKTTLTWSAMTGASLKFGFSLCDLVATARGEGDREWPPIEYDSPALAEVAARIELRRELRLPSRECAVRRPPSEATYCLCLSEAIDAAIASGQPTTRDEVLKAARQEHAERWAWLKREPKPRPEPPALPARALGEVPPQERPPAPIPAPVPEVVHETPTKPAKVVKHFPRWYDPPTRSILDMKF